MPQVEPFETFMKKRELAARAYVCGDAGPVASMTAMDEPASFFGPDGTSKLGTKAVLADFKNGASQFGHDGASELEIFDSGSDGNIGYWTGLQHARVEMKDSGKKVPMTLRITEIFRLEDGEWRLFHRHADMADIKALSN